MHNVRNTFFILLILILILGSLFLFDFQYQGIAVQTAQPAPRYSTSVAWLEMCAVNLSEQLGAFTWL